MTKISSSDSQTKVRENNTKTHAHILDRSPFEDSSVLLKIQYRDSLAGLTSLKYQDLHTNDTTLSKDFANVQEIDEHKLIEFAKGVSWTPQRIAVSGTREERAVCIMARDNFKYRIYSLPGLPT